MTQTRDEGLRFPMAEGRFGSQALALETAAAQACHFRRGSGLVDEDQPSRIKPHARLPDPCPFITRLANVGTLLLAGQQRFF